MINEEPFNIWPPVGPGVATTTVEDFLLLSVLIMSEDTDAKLSFSSEPISPVEKRKKRRIYVKNFGLKTSKYSKCSIFVEANI